MRKELLLAGLTLVGVACGRPGNGRIVGMDQTPEPTPTVVPQPVQTEEEYLQKIRHERPSFIRDKYTEDLLKEAFRRKGGVVSLMLINNPEMIVRFRRIDNSITDGESNDQVDVHVQTSMRSARRPAPVNPLFETSKCKGKYLIEYTLDNQNFQWLPQLEQPFSLDKDLCIYQATSIFN